MSLFVRRNKKLVQVIAVIGRVAFLAGATWGDGIGMKIEIQTGFDMGRGIQ